MADFHPLLRHTFICGAISRCPLQNTLQYLKANINSFLHKRLCRIDMATLDSLKCALKQGATETASPRKPLTYEQYSVGLDTLVRGPGWTVYENFIIPQLLHLLVPLTNSRGRISVLEIGPGPKSVLGCLPRGLRQKIQRYAAFEPNELFASSLKEWLSSSSEMESPLPGLECLSSIHNMPFTLHSDSNSTIATCERDNGETFDLVLFCHSMYGMKPKAKFIEQAIEMLAGQPECGIVVVFHRDTNFCLDELVCHRTASFPTGVVSVVDDDDELDQFASFIAGFLLEDGQADRAIRSEWRKMCRTLGRRDEKYPNQLLFSSPNIMATFTKYATVLSELTMQVPLLKGNKTVKNCEARLRKPVSIVRPTDIQQAQQCIQWALKYGLSLTIVSGGHSGHCLLPNIVAVDMGAFDQVHIFTTGGDAEGCIADPTYFVVAGAGCRMEDIIRKAMAAGITVPLGSRPSVGAGLWLQGGIGHLARLHGLACDSIVGAVVISVKSSQALCIGYVPEQHRPAGAVRPENESDLLWAIKGAGTNFGIVVSVTFKTFVARTYSIRNWAIPLNDKREASLKLNKFDTLVARDLPRGLSADAYLYWDFDQLHLGITMFESSTTTFNSETAIITAVRTVLGPEEDYSTVDSVGLFEAGMYISRMHGGHGRSKTSSFKRCMFLKDIGAQNVADVLVAAIESRPTPFCYLHFLQGGGAVRDVAANATAFGCRDWDFACIITGAWPRDQDGNALARAAVRWVYEVAKDLLPFSSGAYGADLGPDPRDVALAIKAFGPNRPRLDHLKQSLDPRNVLAYACPLRNIPIRQKLIILVTGDICAGKDYCADIWVSAFTSCAHKSLVARTVSISDVTKREYAVATGADVTLLCQDRAYKEQHRLALTTFFRDQVQHRPCLPEEHFLELVESAPDVDVLLITGMRDEAPVASFSHLVPDSRLIEVRVRASEQTRRNRRGSRDSDDDHHEKSKRRDYFKSNLAACDYYPSLVFDNETVGNDAANSFAEQRLFPFVAEKLQRLTDMVRRVPDFPSPGISLRHVLNISQQPDGLTLCTSLLQSHFTGGWDRVNVIACCEAGGYIYASPLASRVNIPLALIREAGKLPPPTVSVLRSQSHISRTNHSKGSRIEMEQYLIPSGSSVLVVDDVLATGHTLCAVLHLLQIVGIRIQDISVMVVAEFPIHRGRDLLRRSGFGEANIQSLLVFDGA
jgi:adenine phosphoribosyltransferase